jgi:predicted SAM-dependent methyltransferase
MPRCRRAARRLRDQAELSIHLGCGSRVFAGRVNIDARPGKGVDLIWDLRVPLPIRDNTATMVYSEHVLEHLYKPDAIKLLEECFRILQPRADGGAGRGGVYSSLYQRVACVF